MTGRVVPMTFGGVEVLVQTVPVAGSEPTSRAGQVAEQALDAFDGAREVIVGAAASTVEAIREIGRRTASPDRFEVEFGLGFSVQGNVIVASGSADATLRVTLTYEAHRQP